MADNLLTLHLSAVGRRGVGKSIVLTDLQKQFKIGEAIQFGGLTFSVVDVRYDVIGSDKPMERAIVKLERID